MTRTYLRRPVWRAQARFEEVDAGFRAHLRSSNCLIECSEPSRAPLKRLLTELQQGVDVQAIVSRYDDFADFAIEAIEQLDRFGYLTDAEFSAASGTVDGQAFRLGLERVIEVTRLEAHCPFTEAILRGRATRAQLVRYAVEYLHIVRQAPALVTPLLNWAWPPTLRALLAVFIGGEWHHDRLIARSLEAVHFDAVELDPSEMLPETFALLSQLGVRATTDPLSTAALLFLFERPNADFHRAFAHACEVNDLPEAFTAPILRHAEVNDGEHHEEIAGLLIDAVCPVPRERADAALSDAVVCVEHLVRLDAALAAIQ